MKTRMDKLQATRTLPPNYQVAGQINLANWRMTIALNLAGLVLLFPVAWLFVRYATLVRPGILSPRFTTVLIGLDILGFFLTLFVTMTLHEGVHGFFFWYFTRARPKIGANLFYAYAAAPGWYFPRNQFLIIGITPLLLLTLGGLLLLPVAPLLWVPRLLLGLTVNAAGAVGDMLVVGWLLPRPGTTYIKDDGPHMILYQDRLPQQQVEFTQLLAQYGLPQATSQAIFQRLVTCYQDGQRHYHTLHHVHKVLTTIRYLADHVDPPADLGAVQLAAWFHDAVYDPLANDNEAASARLAVTMLGEAGLPAGTLAEVSRLILLTRLFQPDTRPGPDDTNAHLLLDADLTTLAAPAADYKLYNDAIRREYDAVSDAQYSLARRELLQRFLDLERIYYTPRMFADSEEAARRNLRHELAQLPPA